MPGRAGGLRGACRRLPNTLQQRSVAGQSYAHGSSGKRSASAWEARLWMAGFWYVMSRRDAHLRRGRAAGGREARRHLLRS